MRIKKRTDQQHRYSMGPQDRLQRISPWKTNFATIHDNPSHHYRQKTGNGASTKDVVSDDAPAHPIVHQLFVQYPGDFADPCTTAHISVGADIQKFEQNATRNQKTMLLLERLRLHADLFRRL